MVAAAAVAGIASRDIKCDNVLLSGPDATVKLADFGWSCADQVRLSSVGTIAKTSKSSVSSAREVMADGNSARLSRAMKPGVPVY